MYKMVCPNCGHLINSNAKFCPNCGYKISGPYYRNFKLQKEKERYFKSYKHKYHKIFIISFIMSMILFFIIIIMIIIGMVYIYHLL